VFALQFATGMRISEVCGLHVGDIDWKEGVIRIRRSTYKHLEVAPKTAAGNRDVNVGSGIFEMLKTYIGEKSTGRLFESRNGTPLVGSTSIGKS
jgi:integrase